MIIILEALKRLKKRIVITYSITLITCLLLIILSSVGAFVDKLNGASSNIISSASIFLTIGLILIIFAVPILIASILRYFYLSYYHLEATLLLRTKYYPEFFIIALITPLINLIYPYKFLKDMFDNYSYGISIKKTITLITSLILFNTIFFIDITLGITNTLKYLEKISSNIMFWFFFSMICTFGGLGVKFISELYSVQKATMENRYLTIQEKET